MSILGLFNFILLQWTGMRLAKEVGARTRWRLLRWVWPLTGWWSDYRWIKQVWPSAQLLMMQDMAEAVSRDLDQEIVNETMKRSTARDICKRVAAAVANLPDTEQAAMAHACYSDAGPCWCGMHTGSTFEDWATPPRAPAEEGPGT